jgi:zinc/manganese transport system substrate-binding protein
MVASPVVVGRTLRMLRGLIGVVVAAVLAGSLAACGSSSSSSSAAGAGSGGVRVVAAENFWGSIATQLAGGKASIQSIIVDPNQDPHSYEPKPSDARAFATAQLVIVNGIGYDAWAPRLLVANPVSGRTVLTVGDLFGLKEGDNPHRWYAPANVEAVANAITADLKRLDPKDAAVFDRQRRLLDTGGLARYHQLIADIRARYAGVPVGASESIFALQAPALGLDLITPASFTKAISEGTDVSAQDTATVQRQLAEHKVKVWIYNSQNATPNIQRLNALARAQHVPIATVTETLTPASASFEQWQVTQLEGIRRALEQATRP